MAGGCPQAHPKAGLGPQAPPTLLGAAGVNYTQASGPSLAAQCLPHCLRENRAVTILRIHLYGGPRRAQAGRCGTEIAGHWGLWGPWGGWGRGQRGYVWAEQRLREEGQPLSSGRPQSDGGGLCPQGDPSLMEEASYVSIEGASVPTVVTSFMSGQFYFSPQN